MKAEELAVIKERAKKATSGPWIGTVSTTNWDTYDIRKSDGEYLVQTYTNGDMEFIAHAREDIPKLVTEVERLTATLKTIAYECDEMIYDGYIEESAVVDVRNIAREALE